MSAPAASAVSGERSVSMPAKVSHPPLRFHPKSQRPRRERLARDLDLSLAVIDKGLYGEHAWNVRYAEVIESDIRAGDYESVAMWTAPAVAAESGEDVPHLEIAFSEYDRADAAEELWQAEIGRKPCREMTEAELESYAKAVAREAYKATRCLAAIRAEQKARGR